MCSSAKLSPSNKQNALKAGASLPVAIVAACLELLNRIPGFALIGSKPLLKLAISVGIDVIGRSIGVRLYRRREGGEEGEGGEGGEGGRKGNCTAIDHEEGGAGGARSGMGCDGEERICERAIHLVTCIDARFVTALPIVQSL